MMMRADESYTPAEGCTAEELLACTVADDIDACMAACNGEEPEEPEEDPEAWVTYGTLTVSEGKTSVKQAPLNVAGVEIWSFKFKAGDEDVKLTSIDLTAIWYGAYTDLKDVYLADENWNRVTRQRNVDNEGNVSLDFLGSYELKANSTTTFTVAAKIAWVAQNGDTYWFKATEVTWPKSVKGLPVETELVSAVTINNLWSVTYTKMTNALSDIKIWEEGTIGNFKIAQTAGSNEDAILVSLKVKQQGSASLESLDNLYLAINGENVADGKVSGKYITFTFKDGGYVISKDRSSNITVKVMWTATAEPTKDIKLEIEAKEDFVVKWDTYGYNLVIAGLAANETLSNGAAITINSSKIAVSFEKNTETKILKTQNDVLFGTLKLKSDEANFEFETLYVTLEDNAWYANAAAQQAVVKKVMLWWKAWELQSYTAGTPGVAVYKFEWISLNKWVQRILDLTMNVKWANVGDKFEANITLNDGTNKSKLVDLDNDKTYEWAAINSNIVSALIFSNEVEVKWATLSLNKKSLPAATYVVSAGNEFVVAKWTLEAWNNSDVLVKTINFNQNWNVTNLANIISTAKLIIAGNEYNAIVTNTDITVDRAFTVEKWSTNKQEFELVVTLNWTAPTWTAPLTINLWMTNADIDAEDNEWAAVTATSTVASFSTITLGTKWDLAVTVENTEVNKNDKSILAWSTWVVVAEYQLKASSEKVNVTDIDVTFSTPIDARVDTVTLTYDGKDYTATPNGAVAKFTNLDGFVVDTTKAPMTVSLDTIKFADSSDNAVTDVTINTFDIKANGATSHEAINKTALAAKSKAFDVVPATVVVTLTSTSNTQSVLNYKVDKWENEIDWNDIKVYVVDSILDTVSNNGWLTWLSVKLNGELILTAVYTAPTTATVTPAVTDQNELELLNWDNEVIVTYVLDWDITNPSYDLDLLRVEYVTDATHTWANLAALIALASENGGTPLVNKMKTLDVVSR